MSPMRPLMLLELILWLLLRAMAAVFGLYSHG